MWTNKTSYESLNGIVDLEYEINQLLNTEQAKTNEENKDGEDTQAEKNGQA